MSEWDAFPLASTAPPSAPQGGSEWDAFPLAKPNGFVRAAEGLWNDISAGFQRVNPVALAEKRGQAVGVLKDGYVDVDGVREPLADYPADRFVTRNEGGATYVYPRTPDIGENALASAGRVLGYGQAHTFGNALAARPATRQSAQDALDLGITPSFAMQGTAQGKIAAAGEQFFPTAGRFARDADRVTGEIGQAAFRLADRAGPGASAADAGGALQRGGESFVRSVKDRRSVLYGAVDQAIPKATSIASPETVNLLETEIGKLAALPNISKTLGNGKLEGWLSDLKSGNLTWEAARALRTEIGEAVGSITGPTADMAQGRLKAIYGALSKDLDAAANAAGPEAARLWKRANDYTRVSQGRIDAAFGKVLGKNVTPEQAYSTLTGMALDGGPRANVSALRQVFHSLPKDDAATVAGTIIRNLGKATPGAQDAAGEAFSAATFLTNWNRMGKEARQIIGSAGFDPGVGRELTKLAGVVERAKEAGTFRNHSNTGNAVLSGAFGAYAAMGDPLMAAIVGSLSHLSARAMTNEGFLKAVNEYAASGHAAPLLKIARSDSPLALEAIQVLRLQAAEATSPQPQPSAAGTATR